MAMPYFTGNNVSKSQIEAVQTVPPFIVTDPREVIEVSVTEPPPNDVSGIFRGCLNIVLCFNKAMEDDSGWLVAGWIKESLSKALKEQPMLSGRLRRAEDGHRQLELVSNDSGVRLIEAKIGLTLQDFLDMKDRKMAEPELVFWKDIDEQNPQLSPLFYVQVTNFKCGGYSIGISCSLLLADLLIMDNFLQRWANIQKEMLSKNDDKKVPIFYLPNLRPPNLTPNGTFCPGPRDNCGQTLIFKVTKDETEGDFENLALFCIDQAEHKLGNKIMSLSSGFSFLVKESPKVIKVQNCKKNEIVVKSHLIKNHKVMVRSSSLKDYSEINEVAFREGNKPVSVSYWIGGVNNGLVVAIPFVNEGVSELNFIITVPN